MSDVMLPRWRCGRMNFENKKVSPDPRQGTLSVNFGESDGLMHLQWVSDDQTPGEDIIVVNDAYLEKLEKPGLKGRTYILKFTSSGWFHIFSPFILALFQIGNCSSTRSTLTSSKKLR